jgi:hypothetical protein
MQDGIVPREARSRRAWRSRRACAPAACRTSRTRAPEADCCSGSLPASIAHRPRSGRPVRSARGSCRAAALPAPARPASLRADAGEAAQDRRVHAPARDLPVPRPQDLRPVQPGRLPRGDRFRRSDPTVPEHARHAVAGLQAGLGCVRRAAAWPPALTGTGVRREEFRSRRILGDTRAAPRLCCRSVRRRRAQRLSDWVRAQAQRSALRSADPRRAQLPDALRCRCRDLACLGARGVAAPARTAAGYITDLAPDGAAGRYAGTHSMAYGLAVLIAPLV